MTSEFQLSKQFDHFRKLVRDAFFHIGGKCTVQGNPRNLNSKICYTMFYNLKRLDNSCTIDFGDVKSMARSCVLTDERVAIASPSIRTLLLDMAFCIGIFLTSREGLFSNWAKYH